MTLIASRYQLGEIIGRGGMSVVYQKRDNETGEARQGNLNCALDDLAVVQAIDLTDELKPYTGAGLDGELTCENLFEYEVPAQ